MIHLDRIAENINWIEEKYKNHYNDLVNKLRSSDKCGIFIGAGLSKGIYQDWDGLVNELSNLLGVEIDNDYPLFMETCKRSNEIEYYRHLHNW